jgi:hypothetical protein
MAELINLNTLQQEKQDKYRERKISKANYSQ